MVNKHNAERRGTVGLVVLGRREIHSLQDTYLRTLQDTYTTTHI